MKRQINRIISVITIVLISVILFRGMYHGASGPDIYYEKTKSSEIAETKNGAIHYADHEILVQMKAGLTKKEAQRLADQYQCSLVGFIEPTGTAQWRMAASKSYEDIIAFGEQLEGEEQVEFAIPNYYTSSQGGETAVPYWKTDLNKKEQAPYQFVNADAFYQQEELLTDPVKVTVFDSGFQNDKRLDYPWTEELETVTERGGHGTHVSGILMGVYPKTKGNLSAQEWHGMTLQEHMCKFVTAIVSGTKVINLSQYDWSSSEVVYTCYQEYLEYGASKPDGYMQFIVKKARLIEYILERMIDSHYEFLLITTAANNSGRSNDLWNSEYYSVKGVDQSLTIYQSITVKGLITEGMVTAIVDPICASAFSYISQPKVRNRILCVGAVDSKGKVAGFCNMSDRVDLMAPGINVKSYINGKVDSLSGTSMSAPFVSGAAAGIWSMNPSWSSETVRDLLLRSCTKEADDTKYSGLKKPILDVKNALEMAHALLNTPTMQKAAPDSENDSQPKVQPLQIHIYDSESGNEINRFELTAEDQSGNTVKLTEADKTVNGETVHWDYLSEDVDGFYFLKPGTYTMTIHSNHYQDLTVSKQVVKETQEIQTFEYNLTAKSEDEEEVSALHIRPDHSAGTYRLSSIIEARGILYYCGYNDETLHRFYPNSDKRDDFLTKDAKGWYPRMVLATDEYLYVALENQYSSYKMAQYTFDGEKCGELDWDGGYSMFEDGYLYSGGNFVERIKVADQSEYEMVVAAGDLGDEFSVSNGMVYYWNTNSELMSCEVDGSNDTVISQKEGGLCYDRVSLKNIRNGKLYYISGYSDNDHTAEVFSFDLRTGERQLVQKRDQEHGEDIEGNHQEDYYVARHDGYFVGDSYIYKRIQNLVWIPHAYDVNTGQEQLIFTEKKRIGEVMYGYTLWDIPGQTRLYYKEDDTTFGSVSGEAEADNWVDEMAGIYHQEYLCSVKLDGSDLKMWKISDLGIYEYEESGKD